MIWRGTRRALSLASLSLSLALSAAGSQLHPSTWFDVGPRRALSPSPHTPSLSLSFLVFPPSLRPNSFRTSPTVSVKVCRRIHCRPLSPQVRSLGFHQIKLWKAELFGLKMEELYQVEVYQRDATGLIQTSSPSLAASATTSKVLTVAAVAAPPAFFHGKAHCWADPLSFTTTHYHPLHPETSSSSSPQDAFQRRAAASSSDIDTIKASIISHPQYSSLLSAYVNCQKVN